MGKLGEAVDAGVPKRLNSRGCTVCEWVNSLTGDDRDEAVRFLSERSADGKLVYGHAYLSRLIASAYKKKFAQGVLLNCRREHHGPAY